MKSYRLKAYLLSLLFLISCTHLYATDLLLKDRQTLITLGNSITEGGEYPEGYVSLLRKSLEVLYPERTIYVINVGISGHKATDMSDRFERDVLQHRPNWVTISVGVNDVWHGFYDNHPRGDGPRGVPLDLFRQKLVDMITRAQNIGIKVALFTTTIIKENLKSPENQKLVAYNQEIRKIAKKHQCLLVDMNQAFHNALKPVQKPGISDRGVLTNDGVHMLPSGNWLMAKTVLHAFGVSEERLELVKPLVEKMVSDEKALLAKNAARYQEINYEVGAPCKDEQRVVFFGSSSVDMWNLSSDFPKIVFLNRGIGGENSRQMALRFRQDVVNLKPKAVIIFLGSCNDFWPHNKMTTAETKSNLIKFARLAQGANIKLAVGAVSPVNDYIPGKNLLASHPLDQVMALNEWIKAFCTQNGFDFIDFYSAVADSSGKLDKALTDDGMHCNAAGYARWKPLVDQALKDLAVVSEP